MCGRYSLRNPEQAYEEFSILERSPAVAPRYNIAPTQLVPVVRAGTPAGGPQAAPSHGGFARHIDDVKWGLPSRRGPRPVIMLRLESLASGAFDSSFRGRRCIMVADGFFEWEQRGKVRVPHFIHRSDDRPLALAGIWQPGAQPGDPDTCAVITKPAVAPLVDLHDRMPATVERKDYDRWLDPGFTDREAVADILNVDIGLELTVAEVSTWVNAAAHDDPKCVEPIS